MPHVDEGTLHALLDGELGAAEVLKVQTHFATCAACAARLDEARQLLAETERLVTALEPPAGGAASAPRLLVGRPMIPLDPVVLIPDNPTATEVRRSRFKVMGWAAGFLVVVGAGFLALEARSALSGGRRGGSLRIRPEEFTFVHSKSDSVAPPSAQAKPDNAPPAAERSAPPAAPAKPPQAAPTKPAAPPTPAPPPPAQAGKLGAAAGKSPPPEPAPAQKPAAPPEQKATAAPAPAPPARQETAADRPAADAQPADEEDAADSASDARLAAAARPPGEDRTQLAERAAKATEALDRERIRERAAAATAELDRERERERAAAEDAQRRAAAQANAAAARPAVPTIDQQARLSNRIGLDEAARQLGGPLHAIDGMTRQLVGLVSPQLVPGADTSRPVVRAVYVDRNGRTLYLDQQRVRPGQLDLPFTPQTGPNGQQSWMAGSVMLVLQGDFTPDSLRALARRVR